MTSLRNVILCSLLAVTGCGEDLSTPTSPSAGEVTFASEFFSGTLAPRATRFYSFTVTTAGTVSATLASLVPATSRTPSSHRLEVGIGIPAGTGCAVTTVMNTPPALVAQVMQSPLPGIYCVRVADVDGLPGPMTFAIRIAHP